MIFALNDDDIKIQSECKFCIYFFNDSYNFHKKAILNIANLEKNLDIKFSCVNIDFFNFVIKRFDLKQIPTFIFYNKGREKNRLFHILEYSLLEKEVRDIFKLGVKK